MSQSGNLRAKAITLLCASFELLSKEEVAKTYDDHDGNLNEVCAVLSTLEVSKQRNRNQKEEEAIPLAEANGTTDLGWIKHTEHEEEEEEMDEATRRKKALLQKNKRNLLTRTSAESLVQVTEDDEATAQKKASLQANKQSMLMRVRTTVSGITDEEASKLIVDGVHLDKIQFDYADEPPKLVSTEVDLGGHRKKRLVVKLITSVADPLTHCKKSSANTQKQEDIPNIIHSITQRFENTGFELGQLNMIVERTPRDFVVLRANLLSTLTKSNEVNKNDEAAQLILPPIPNWVPLALRTNSSSKAGAGAGATAAALAAGISVATAGAAVPIVAPIAAAVVGGSAAVAAVTQSNRNLRHHIEEELAKCTFIKDVQEALLTSTAPAALKDHAIRTLKRFMTHGGHKSIFQKPVSRPSITSPAVPEDEEEDVDDDHHTIDGAKKKIKKKNLQTDKFQAAWKETADTTSKNLQRPSRPAPPPPPNVKSPPAPPVFQM
uniref:Uncharacterized protein n=1 Tax=Aureoumbra lagunensis TaxID=44058 RepID=A0A7S3NPQ9_9STRA|mmetsp:Transcript_11231/g.15430  ORF Transcript_11231/g.15430 Transcript_11231/m.15430 type:complete len:492 (+) Transcript_11231:104-1579(+)|eukprot:CAMPEP_0197286394 /NCGR_PEP_ID=MMETSP0890-20130614/1815_1 /TAXON_ID=44058 ORGANISM="Aureoumbra lagunensis, Strain CCMP1510" /NCGR_SAMPLE_ID=MMETSP0890 /ASSEMBLY_ACC=CAM_ASM_000533 /LENGTH=491 /DNA_ID=CAMNT_0042754683 /DNA_START=102 /DNA_END=1577 /DNA_ORIENTATION=+